MWRYKFGPHEFERCAWIQRLCNFVQRHALQLDYFSAATCFSIMVAHICVVVFGPFSTPNFLIFNEPVFRLVNKQNNKVYNQLNFYLSHKEFNHINFLPYYLVQRAKQIFQVIPSFQSKRWIHRNKSNCFCVLWRSFFLHTKIGFSLRLWSKHLTNLDCRL